MPRRTTRRRCDDCRSKRSGRRRSTSTNTTVDIVSTADLREREVGRAREDEQARHGVAAHAEEHRRGEAPADDGGAQGGDQHDDATGASREAAERRPARPVPAASRAHAGSDRGGGEDHADVDRQRPVLDEAVTRVETPPRPRSRARYISAPLGIAPPRPTGAAPIGRHSTPSTAGRA